MGKFGHGFLLQLHRLLIHRFGAVMEEFEVRDAVENVLSTKPEFGMVY